jgi:hypothetical protein
MSGALTTSPFPKPPAVKRPGSAIKSSPLLPSLYTSCGLFSLDRNDINSYLNTLNKDINSVYNKLLTLQRATGRPNTANKANRPQSGYKLLSDNNPLDNNLSNVAQDTVKQLLASTTKPTSQKLKLLEYLNTLQSQLEIAALNITQSSAAASHLSASNNDNLSRLPSYSACIDRIIELYQRTLINSDNNTAPVSTPTSANATVNNSLDVRELNEEISVIAQELNVELNKNSSKMASNNPIAALRRDLQYIRDFGVRNLTNQLEDGKQSNLALHKQLQNLKQQLNQNNKAYNTTTSTTPAAPVTATATSTATATATPASVSTAELESLGAENERLRIALAKAVQQAQLLQNRLNESTEANYAQSEANETKFEAVQSKLNKELQELKLLSAEQAMALNERQNEMSALHSKIQQLNEKLTQLQSTGGSSISNSMIDYELYSSSLLESENRSLQAQLNNLKLEQLQREKNWNLLEEQHKQSNAKLQQLLEKRANLGTASVNSDDNLNFAEALRDESRMMKFAFELKFSQLQHTSQLKIIQLQQQNTSIQQQLNEERKSHQQALNKAKA